MTESYLGIITPRGLETLVVETEHAAPFLLRRARLHPEAACCWAVLEEGVARVIARLIGCQRTAEALKLLNLRALHLGTVLPAQADEESLRACP